MSGNMFLRSAYTHCGGGGHKKTWVYIEDLPLPEKFDEDEINLFIKYGERDIKKVEKTQEEIKQDMERKIKSLDDTDPHFLLEKEQRGKSQRLAASHQNILLETKQ